VAWTPVRNDRLHDDLSRALAAAGAPRGTVSLAGLSPMLATLIDEPFSDPDWLFEIKYDGVRVLAERDGERVTLAGRSGQDFTPRYPEIVDALRALPVTRFLIDGEIVALDAAGRPSFQTLQLRMHLTRPADVARARGAVPVTGVFFDLLALDGHDLRGLPLVERKRFLSLVVPAQGIVRFGGHVAGDGKAFLEAACARHLEGIVAKLASSRYTSGRSRDWLKIKCQLRQEFVIGGYTEPQGSRAYFGALHLGLYDGDRLVYASKVGTGFDDRTLTDVWAKLRPLERPTSPFDAGTPPGRGHHWVEPRLVCEVRFTEWTEEGGLRHPAFMGLRDDKRPEECRREVPVHVARPTPRNAARPIPSRPASKPATGRQRRDTGRDVRLTNLDKVFWPEDGITKGDLIGYYETVAPLVLPYLDDRPVVLTRYPDGIHGKSFFQKDAPEFAPSWLRTARIWSEQPRRQIDYIVIDSVDALRFVANLGTIPLHVWASRVRSLERPDWLVLDLDPKGAPFTDVVKVALATREVLDRLELPSHVKTSGATGLHILLPLGARYSDDQVRSFAQLLATLVVQAVPRIATVARPLRARGGKVYVDWGQNGRGQTIVAPFSVRPLPGAPVSCPLRWDEVTPALDPRRFTIRTVPERFEALPDPLAPVLMEAIDLGDALARVERFFGGSAPNPTGPGRTSGASAASRAGVTRRRGTARGSDARTRGRSRTPRA